jgi:hypothetical protein
VKPNVDILVRRGAPTAIPMSAALLAAAGWPVVSLVEWQCALIAKKGSHD